VGRHGEITLEAAPLPSGNEPSAPRRLALAAGAVDVDDLFLYHKTTHRHVYDSALATRGPCDDVVLWNAEGQVTETTIANLVVEKHGRLVTPPIRCGLLAGVYREHLLKAGEIAEEIVTIEDLRNTAKIFAVNSVRRWMPAVFCA
jgi:para-aminobenzoate synthetase/4-amino-4-deoxychorismate lyase